MTKAAPKSYISSNKAGPLRRRLAIHGKPGSGKTIAAMSLVEGFGKLMPRFLMGPDQVRKLKWEKLDALWISADTNATAGARARRIEVPELNLAALLGDAPNQKPDPTLEIMEDVYYNVYGYVEKHKPQVVCLDTSSAVDKPLCAYRERNAPMTRAGGRDSFHVWRNTTADHQRLHDTLSALPCDVVFLMHSKPRSESESANKKARAQAIAGRMADIRFDFMYEDAANLYRRHNDLVLVADYQHKNGKRTWQLHTEEFGGFEAKSRYVNLVPETIEPDLWGVYQKYIEI